MEQDPFTAPTELPPSQGRPLTHVLAALGAWLASAFWLAVLALNLVGGTLSGLTLLAPILLIGLYAWRGLQVFSGNTAMAYRLVGLHLIGLLYAFYNVQIAEEQAVRLIFYVKLAIHSVGMVTAGRVNGLGLAWGTDDDDDGEP